MHNVAAAKAVLVCPEGNERCRWRSPTVWTTWVTGALLLREPAMEKYPTGRGLPTADLIPLFIRPLAVRAMNEMTTTWARSLPLNERIMVSNRSGLTTQPLPS
jgi:hypothetical protein